MPAEFQFLRPLWLLAMPVALALIFWRATRPLDAGNWRAVVDERLRPWVLEDRGEGGRGRAAPWLTAAIAVLASLALAGPTWERQQQPLYRGGDALVVALDLSRSMDAADVSPSRLERARLKLRDLLERRRDGQTALIVYTAHAFTVTPLTDDTETIAALIGSLGTDIMPSRGSLPARALEKARELLTQAGAGRGHVLLITDGAAGDPLPVADELRRDGYRVSVLGVGTAAGGPVPKADGGFVTDGSGRMVLPALDEGMLREIAAAGGGIYRHLSVDDSDLRAVLAAMGPTASRAGEDGGEQFYTDLWHDQGPWLALALLPLAALAFRRGWLFVIVVLALPLPQPAQAAGWQDLWLNRDQQGVRALEAGRPDEAAELFEDPAWQGAARYRAGDYVASARAWAGLDTADAHYNRGNALARQGEYEAALQAYEQALAEAPDHEDARYNRDVLRRAMQQQQQAGGEGESGEGEEQQSDGEQQAGDERSEGGEEGEGSESRNADGQNGQDDEQQGGEGSRQAASDGESSPSSGDDQEAIEELREAMRQAAEDGEQGDEDGQRNRQAAAALSAEERSEQEQMQAMEQWLRRVPNDPGGLLRRKFRDQYQRQGRDQDGNRLWTDEEVQPW